MKALLSTLIFTLISLFVLAQNEVTKVIKIEPFMSSENYEYYRRLVFNSPDSEIDVGLEGFNFE